MRSCSWSNCCGSLSKSNTRSLRSARRSASAFAAFSCASITRSKPGIISEIAAHAPRPASVDRFNPAMTARRPSRVWGASRLRSSKTDAMRSCSWSNCCGSPSRSNRASWRALLIDALKSCSAAAASATASAASCAAPVRASNCGAMSNSAL